MGAAAPRPRHGVHLAVRAAPRPLTRAGRPATGALDRRHFVEHLGGVIYDGVWVGEASRVPNVGGIRRDLVDARATVLSAHDVHDVNTFENPGVVVPRQADTSLGRQPLVFTFPAASVTRLEIVLGA